MATAFYSSYKPQVLSRQEGFHLPSPAPSTPPSSDGTPSSLPSSANNHASSSANAFDAHNLFISPPSYLSVPETFRKFPSASTDHTGHGAPSMDFSDELASLISHPHPSSHERSTQSPVSVSAYDDYQHPTTHNIFDVSAPTSRHHHSSSHSSNHHVPNSPHSPFPSNGPNAFSLPPSSSLSSSTTAHGLHTPGSSLQTPTHPLHEFTSHFNSTVPAIGSSMRYEPPSSSHGHSSTGQSNHPFALNVNTSGSSSSNNNTSNSPNSNSSGNEPSSFSSHAFPDSFTHLNGTRQTPSPILPPPHGSSARPDYSRTRDDFSSRSRSRSRSQAQPPLPPSEPPSTNGGPARTRTTRPKRNSVSSVSPPPSLHRGHHLTQPLVIPASSPVNGSSATQSAGPRSPLSLHTSGWFQPGSLGTSGLNHLNGMNGMNGINSTLNGMNGYGAHGLNGLNTHSMGSVGSLGEFSLPTPDSVHGFFGGQGSSPKEMSGLGGAGPGSLGTTSGLQGKDGATDDVASKQAQLANEKRRRRRESHNAVERRRRDNINEKISELATLIPECLLDPNSTLTVPATVTPSDDGLFGVAALSSPNPNKEGSSPEGAKKEDDSGDKDGEGAGVVKANKGMILRKSVEYIRYLQQLVSAQATRNRELEQQLHSYRGDKDSASPSSSTAHTNGEDDALMLHEEVGDFNLSLNGHTTSGNPPVLSRRHSSTNGSSRKRFGGFELESVAEMEQDTDHHANDDVHDHDMERPSTSGTGAGASPLSGSGSDDQDHDEHEEEERGRKGRDGRPMGFGHGVAMKMEEGDSMETC